MLKDICQEYGVNEEQAQALDTNKNIALKAGAGSGKTRVLTCRYLRLLSQGIDIDRIVAITFTKKAATKMKEEIRKRITAKIEQSLDAREREKWKNIRTLIAAANINTIHSFLSNLLKDNFALLGIDPNFEIMEEVDGAIKLSQFAEESIHEYLENPQNEFLVNSVLDAYSTKIITSGSLKEDTIILYQNLREKGIELNKVTPSNRPLEKMALELIKVLHVKYQDFKSRERLLDYNDLEIMTEKLLDNKEVRLAYLERYYYFLVDEFQDVNSIQKRILDKLVVNDDDIIPPGRLFIVGDHKQSIYGFRGSDYQIFEQTCSLIEKNGQVSLLTNCYRSTKNIVDGVNCFFEQLLDPFERLKIPEKKKSLGAKIELVTWTGAKNPYKEQWDNLKKLLPDDSKDEELKKILHNFKPQTPGNWDCQGEALAKKIMELRQRGFSFKEMAILLRSRSSLKTIENSLLKNSIPYCVLGGIGFWGRQEVIDIIALYKFIFDPENIADLLTVLRSPIFGFSDDLIFNIMTNKQGNVLETLESSLDFEEDWLIQRTLKILKKCLKYAEILNAYQLIKKLCQETSYPQILLALPDGQRKFRNLEKLFAIVREFERKGIYTARELPDYLKELEENSGMTGESFLDTEDNDAVKILTIHAAKGLEFGAVFLPNLEKALDFISKRNKPLFYYSEGKGIVALELDEEGKEDIDANPDYAEIFHEKLLKENSDSRRVFYVAATRAQKYLCLMGEDQELKKNNDPLALNSFMRQLKWALARMEETPWLEHFEESCQAVMKQNRSHYSSEVTKMISFSLLQNKDSHSRIEVSPRGNISISMYLKYLDCPRLYHFSYLAGLQSADNELSNLPEDDINQGMKASLRGTLIHKFLENMGKKTQYDQPFANMEEEIKRALDNFNKAELIFSQGKVGKLIQSFNEFVFRVVFETGLTLNGAIDRVDIYENNGKIEAYVIDYKTNKISGEKELAKKADYYKKQLYAYSYALTQLPVINGVRPEVKGAYLYFLNCGQCIEIKVTDQEIRKLKKEILTASPWLLGWKSFEEYPLVEGEKCSWCQYRTYCKREIS